MSAAAPRDLPALVARYLAWLESHRFSPRTKTQRASQLGRFLAWCETRSIKTANEVTRSILERYQRTLSHHRQKNGRPLSRRTQAHLINAVRVFFRWLHNERVLLHNPAADVEAPRFERHLPRQVLTPIEVEQVLAAIDVATPLGLRDRAILETLYSTGLRRAEIGALRVDELDPDHGTVFVREGKGGRDRLVPIGRRAVLWIERYLAEVRPTFAKSDSERVLFLGRTGAPLCNNRLSEIGAEAVKAAGLDKKGACHVFRHSAATAMLEAGADIRFIQAMLGHAHLSSTQVYTKVSITKLKEVHTKTHPAKLTRAKADGEE